MIELSSVSSVSTIESVLTKVEFTVVLELTLLDCKESSVYSMPNISLYCSLMLS